MRLGPVPLLALLLAAPALAQGRPPALQGPWTYAVEGTLEGRALRGQVTLDRAGEAGVSLEARWSAGAGGGLPARFAVAAGQAEPTGWRFELPASLGVAGRLGALDARPARARPSALVVRRLPGDRIRGFVLLEGRLRGTFRGERVADPARPCRPTRDAWWARHAVATWEVGRALWDFYRPGSRRFEELRGDATRADTAALRAALPWPGPFSPEQLYAAARARTGSAREALALCFGLLVDHGDLPLAPLPGIPAEAPRHDKYEHYFASAIMARRGNARGSFTVGWLKEVLDEVSGTTGYDEEDLIADALGAEFGQSLQCECEGPLAPR